MYKRQRITVEPGLIGGEVNRILAHHHKTKKTPTQYKIGPDPSSIDSCMIGGIVANNSSGMCCGVSQNTYHTLQDMRVVMPDGTVLDTADAASRAAFAQSHAPLLEGVAKLARRVQVRPVRSYNEGTGDCTSLTFSRQTLTQALHVCPGAAADPGVPWISSLLSLYIK